MNPEKHPKTIIKQHNFASLPRLHNAKCFPIGTEKKLLQQHSFRNYPGIIFHLFKQLVETGNKWKISSFSSSALLLENEAILFPYFSRTEEIPYFARERF